MEDVAEKDLEAARAGFAAHASEESQNSLMAALAMRVRYHIEGEGNHMAALPFAEEAAQASITCLAQTNTGPALAECLKTHQYAGMIAYMAGQGQRARACFEKAEALMQAYPDGQEEEACLLQWAVLLDRAAYLEGCEQNWPAMLPKQVESFLRYWRLAKTFDTESNVQKLAESMARTNEFVLYYGEPAKLASHYQAFEIWLNERGLEQFAMQHPAALPSLLRCLGEVLARVGQTERAGGIYETARKLCPSTPPKPLSGEEAGLYHRARAELLHKYCLLFGGLGAANDTETMLEGLKAVKIAEEAVEAGMCAARETDHADDHWRVFEIMALHAVYLAKCGAFFDYSKALDQLKGYKGKLEPARYEDARSYIVLVEAQWTIPD